MAIATGTRTQTVVDLEPSFSDVVFILTTPPPDEELELGMRICGFAALFAYSLLHPVQLARWLSANTQCLPKSRTTKLEVVSWPRVIQDFLFSPMRCPEDHARRAVGRTEKEKGSAKLLKGTVRVKWYPDVDATLEWPPHLGMLWMDLPLEPNGDLDLRPAIRQWGMENCYIIDANRGRPQLERHPSERLTALAVDVLLPLDGHHCVIGIVECPSEHMQAARRGRALVTQALWPGPKRLACYLVKTTPGAARYLAQTAAPSLVWTTLQLTAFVIAGTIVLLADWLQEVSGWAFRTVILPVAGEVRHFSTEVLGPALDIILADLVALFRMVVRLMTAIARLLIVLGRSLLVLVRLLTDAVGPFLWSCWAWTLAISEALLLTEEQVEEMESYRHMGETEMPQTRRQRPTFASQAGRLYQ